MFKKLAPFTKNFYFVTGALFLFWMLFLDTNDILSQFQLRHKLHDLKREKDYYTQKIQEVKVERQQLLTDKDMLEKFAREKYFMKKDHEDLFVIVPKK